MLVSINGVSKNVENNLTVLQACESLGVTIPHFCYHDRLSIAGNCRMCLVEEIKSVKPLVSCAVSITPSMEIFTNTELVKKAREGVIEFLLANHPLDCPICDQGGECDLQDQSLLYGGDRGRFYEEKRAVSDKNCGPLIKTIMTRCIHCTRCVRFMQDVAGFPFMGVSGRGSKMEIGFYVEKFVTSELSGNIIDLCPVGALTSKPYAFSARSWELHSIESLDFFDSIHSNIRIDIRGTNIMRILPKINHQLNEDWISDKIRFAFDALKYQRITVPLLRSSHGKLYPISWELLFMVLKTQFDLKHKNSAANDISGIVGPFISLETLCIFKNLLSLSGSSNFLTESLFSLERSASTDFSTDFFFNFPNVQVNAADLCLFIGTNPKVEAPVLNVKFRKLFQKGANIYNIGFTSSSTYYIKTLGNSMKTLLAIIEGTHWFTSKLLNAQKPLIIIGESAFCIPGFQKLIPLLQQFVTRQNWVGFGCLPATSSILHASEVGFNPGIHGVSYGNMNSSINYLLGTNKISLTTSTTVSNKSNHWVIYQGHHGIASLSAANLIIPSLSPFEQSSNFINIFGHVQQSRAAYFGLNNLKCDSEFLRDLLYYLIAHLWNKPLRKAEICRIFVKRQLIDNPIRSVLGFSTRNSLTVYTIPFFLIKSFNFFFFYNTIPSKLVHNFYRSDNFSANSKTMLLCSQAFYKNKSTFSI